VIAPVRPLATQLAMLLGTAARFVPLTFIPRRFAIMVTAVLTASLMAASKASAVAPAVALVLAFTALPVAFFALLPVPLPWALPPAPVAAAAPVLKKLNGRGSEGSPRL
jgi:hypothetical protein